jgi:hypothetical protein
MNAQQEAVGEVTVDFGDFQQKGGIPDCDDRREYRLAPEATALVTVLTYGHLGVLAGFVGQLAGVAAKQVEDAARKTGGSLSELAVDLGASERYAKCGTVAVVVPTGAKITDVVTLAREADGGDWSECSEEPPTLPGNHLCAIGWSGWTWNANGRVVVGVFKNWSHDRARGARLVVRYSLGDQPGVLVVHPEVHGPASSDITAPDFSCWNGTWALSTSTANTRWLFQIDGQKLKATLESDPSTYIEMTRFLHLDNTPYYRGMLTLSGKRRGIVDITFQTECGAAVVDGLDGAWHGSFSRSGRP